MKVIKRFKCKVTKNSYRVGQVYDGERTEELQKLGYVESYSTDTVPASTDEFSELKADQQKAILSQLGIAGDAGNAEKRLALYASYLEASST